MRSRNNTVRKENAKLDLPTFGTADSFEISGISTNSDLNYDESYMENSFAGRVP